MIPKFIGLDMKVSAGPRFIGVANGKLISGKRGMGMCMKNIMKIMTTTFYIPKTRKGLRF